MKNNLKINLENVCKIKLSVLPLSCSIITNHTKQLSIMKLIPNQNNSYFSAKDAIIENGFEFIGKFNGSRNAVGKVKSYEVFYKEEKGYMYFAGMNHFNTQIYDITLKPLPKPLGHYDQVG